MVKCSRCGKDCEGIELSPGAVSSICEECHNPPKTKPAGRRDRDVVTTKKESK